LRLGEALGLRWEDVNLQVGSLTVRQALQRVEGNLQFAQGREEPSNHFTARQHGHRDASITLRVYAHWLPDVSRREADRLDTMHQSATPAHPESEIDDPTIAAKFFGLSGEPPRNRTENPQIKSRIKRSK
jgi:integrase